MTSLIIYFLITDSNQRVETGKRKPITFKIMSRNFKSVFISSVFISYSWKISKNAVKINSRRKKNH